MMSIEPPLQQLHEQGPGLQDCEREAIDRPGAIQPHGCILVCALPGWTVPILSDNCQAVLGKGAEELLDLPLDHILPHKLVHDLRNVLQSAMVSGGTERLFGGVIDDRGRIGDLILHLAGARAVIEIVPRDVVDATASEPGMLVRSMIGRLMRAPTVSRFLSLAAHQVRAVTGFDRVMMYKFLSDDTGQVVAEALRSGLTPYLGQRYPASDIPAQARALYRRQWLRSIPDVDYAPSRLVSRSAQASEMDLSLAVLRSVSPVHLDYLRNMGARATLTVSLMDGDRLWGLIACHHATPRLVSTSICATTELFAQILSMQIAVKEQADELIGAAEARRTHDRLLASMAPDDTLFDNLGQFGPVLQELIGCDGIGLWTDRGLVEFGAVPPPAAMRDIIRLLDEKPPALVYATDALGAALGSETTGDTGGLLAIPFQRAKRDYLIFFRRQSVQTIVWGGDPRKLTMPSGPQTGPRTSFEAWRETVQGRGLPWRAVELQIAETLRVSLLEIILRRADLIDRERKVAAERQGILIAELNHRVKNTLALMRALVRQTRQGATDVAAFGEQLEQRVLALAQAHDLLTSAGWRHAPLRPLVEAEARAWAGEPGRISLEGPPVTLDSHAFQALSLVLHEMMTNAAKYGALSHPSGRLAISWAWDEASNLTIEWREAGGPPVSPPGRRGFGSVVIEHALPFELGGDASIDFRPEGIRGTFLVPAAHAAPGEPKPDVRAKAGRIEPLGAKRLLLVEDSLMIALDAQSMLGEAGFEVEVAGTLIDARRALEVADFEAVILDINLSGETCFDLADELDRCNLPFVFATSYGETLAVPDRFSAVPLVSKPYQAPSMRRALRSAEDACGIRRGQGSPEVPGGRAGADRPA